MAEYELSKFRQNARLRRLALALIDGAKAAGGLRGRVLFDAMDQTPECPEDDDAMLGLLRDLVNGGYVVETDLRRRIGECRGLDVLSYSVTARGTALLEERIDPDPLIDDQRLRRVSPAPQ
jgi:hypothetical protein